MLEEYRSMKHGAASIQESVHNMIQNGGEQERTNDTEESQSGAEGTGNIVLAPENYASDSACLDSLCAAVRNIECHIDQTSPLVRSRLLVIVAIINDAIVSSRQNVASPPTSRMRSRSLTMFSYHMR